MALTRGTKASSRWLMPTRVTGRFDSTGASLTKTTTLAISAASGVLRFTCRDG